MKQKLKSINKAIFKACLAISLVLFILIIFNLFGKIDLSEISSFSTILNNLLTPLLTFAAILITFLAFYVQYQFNKKQSKIIKKQNKIVKEQHLIAIKQSFDPYFLRILDIHSNLINDLNLETVNIAINKVNTENRKKIEEIKEQKIFFEFSVITKNNKEHNAISYLNQDKNTFTSLPTEDLKNINHNDQIFEHFFELLTALCNHTFQYQLNFYNYRVKQIKYAFRDKDLTSISSLFSSIRNKYSYLTIFFLKYNNFLETLIATITNKKFHSDPPKNLKFKQDYLVIFFQSLQTYEYFYCYFYLCLNHIEFMNLYYFSETETTFNPTLSPTATNRFIVGFFNLILAIRDQK